MRVIACFASSLDGRISPAEDGGAYVRISSDEDIRHLKAVRQQADAVLMGGRTFRAYPKPHRRLDGTPVPWHGIWTRGGEACLQAIPPDSPLFTHTPALAVQIFSPLPVPETVQAAYPTSVGWTVLPSEAAAGSVSTILDTFAQNGVQTLLVEGGGEVLAQFLNAQAVQELYLTLCPVLLGGQAAPLVGGQAAWHGVESAPRTHLLSQKRLGEELFLHLAIQYSN